jgi:hypothetical protein
VVKSYPQSSQNSAPAAFAAPQFGQDCSAGAGAASRSSTEPGVAAAGCPDGVATADGAAAGAEAGGAIGAPQTSQ